MARDEPQNMNRLHPHWRIVARLAVLWAVIALLGCAVDQQIQTLKPGILTVAVTSDAPTNQYDSQLWIRNYVEKFAAEHELTISWVVVPFNESWLLRLPFLGIIF